MRKLLKTYILGTLALIRVAGTIDGPSVAAAEVSSPVISAQVSPANAAPITNAAQILALSADQMKASPSVQICGVITFYERSIGLFVQDATAGIFVYYTRDPLEIKPGQHVEVTGVANRGRYSPIIDLPHIRPLNSGPTITPRRVSLAEIYLGGLDAQWVEVTGVVRVQNFIGNQVVLELAVPPHRLKVWVTHCDDQHRSKLVGNAVRLTGVVGTLSTDQGQAKGFQVFVNDIADLEVVQASPPDSFSAPLLSIRDLKTQHARVDGVGRVRTKGIITWCAPKCVFIQDSSGGLQVLPSATAGDLIPGDAVEVAGFLGPVLEDPLIEDAVIRKLDSGNSLQPLLLSGEDLFQGRHIYELIEIEASLIGRVNTLSNVVTLGLQVENHFVTALLDLHNSRIPEGLEAGCRVHVSGVNKTERSAVGAEPTVALLARSPADVKIISSPLSAQKVGFEILLIAVILVAAGMGLALWYLQKQRRQTEHVVQLQASLQAEMKQSQQQLRRSMEERERIGRNLHDDIIQSIYAVGLNLEDCRRVVLQSPREAESRLVSVINMLNNTIRSVRGFIAGLEPKVLNGREFRTALKSLALTSGDGHGQFHIEVDPTAANRLSSIQATQLLHISKEAMSNSLRHAQASSVSVSLYPVSSGVCLEVRDNGTGFRPDTTGGVGHGLRNMTARAREIAAELQILSAPGEGCRILVTVPPGNANEPN